MKKYILIVLLLVFGSASYAQRLSLNEDELDLVVLSMNLDGPAMASLEMKQELNLTDAQFAQVQKLNAERFAQLENAEASNLNSYGAKNKKFRTINLQNDRGLETVLTEQQLKQYRELEGRFNMQFLSEHEAD
ncbi:hypothetical protein GCM10028895_09830 [Pontibacter rugosus]